MSSSGNSQGRRNGGEEPAVRDQRSEVRDQRSEDNGGIGLCVSASLREVIRVRIAECGVVLVAVVVLLVLGFALGRNYERINALAAEPTAPVVTITRAAAAARIAPRCPTVRRDDLRVARPVDQKPNRVHRVEVLR